MNIRDLFQYPRRFFAVKRHIILLIMAGILGLFIGTEIGLNIWVRSLLESSLLSQSKTTTVQSGMSWMSLPDFLYGRVGWVRVDARNCRVGNVDYDHLKINTEGFIYNLPLLIKERRLAVIGLSRTRVQAVIKTQSMENYLNAYYSEYQPHIAIRPNTIEMTGIVKIFGSMFPVRLVGTLELSGPKKLHFYPTSLRLGNRPVSGSLLQFVATQIPLEFSVLEEWPLQISDFSLRNGSINISLKED